MFLPNLSNPSIAWSFIQRSGSVKQNSSGFPTNICNRFDEVFSDFLSFLILFLLYSSVLSRFCKVLSDREKEGRVR